MRKEKADPKNYGYKLRGFLNRTNKADKTIGTLQQDLIINFENTRNQEVELLIPKGTELHIKLDRINFPTGEQTPIFLRDIFCLEYKNQSF